MKNNRIKLIISTITALMLLFSFSFGLVSAGTEISDTSKASRATHHIYDSEIEEIYFGNSLHGNESEWIKGDLKYSGGKYVATLPATYNYVRVRTMVWGMPTSSQYWDMNGQSPLASNITAYFDENGVPCSPGSIVYGMQEMTVWAIPQSAPISNIIITLYSAKGDKQMLCDITWEGNGGAGPSTASIATADGDTVKLSGVDNTMEYRTTGGAWITCVENQLIPVGEGGINVDVRYAATSDSRASDSITLTMDRKAAPSPTLNEEEKIIYGVDNTMEYKVDSGVYTSITGSTLPISDLITPNPTTFFIRYKGNNELASCEWSGTVYPIPAAPTTPKYELTTYDHRISGINSTMEMLIGDRTDWESWGPSVVYVTFNNTVNETSETIVSVRYKATADKPASAIKIVTLPKAYKPPTGAYLKGLYIKGLQPGLPYELVYSDYNTRSKTYYGVVDSDGDCRREIIAGPGIGATYRIRYRGYSGIGSSPWKYMYV